MEEQLVTAVVSTNEIFWHQIVIGVLYVLGALMTQIVTNIAQYSMQLQGVRAAPRVMRFTNIITCVLWPIVAIYVIVMRLHENHH